MVDVNGWEIPKHATGWDRIKAMSDSSWKRDAMTVGAPGPAGSRALPPRAPPAARPTA
jgi:hypothetical protein